VWNGSDLASPACMAANGATEVWKCYLPEYSMAYIQTPMLVSNSAIDMWGLGNIIRLGCIPTQNNQSFNGFHPCNPQQWGTLQAWWTAFYARITPLLAASPLSRSAFIASCFVHGAWLKLAANVFFFFFFFS
jgi:hypothetical protein